VPVLLPISKAIGIEPLFFAILIALNLQTSFLTPPFGFSLFYLKGVTPPEMTTRDIYRGVVPFIILQVIVLFIVAIYPQVFGLVK
jgi:TRAP-type mannitol/chloroaromatic compound transport system permease large subunit